MSEKNRYSDSELVEFKELILEKIEEAKKSTITIATGDFISLVFSKIGFYGVKRMTSFYARDDIPIHEK